jgi:hypothetical protein
MSRRRKITRALSGALVGLVIGMIASINVAIFAGIEGGYEANIAEVFDDNVLVGIVSLLMLAAGPIIGVTIALRERRPG